MLRIGIVGCGVVGGAVRDGMLRLGHDVKVHDIKMDTTINSLHDREIIFVCVPTPQNKNGSCDTSIVESVLEDLSDICYGRIVAIKSTVTPGTTQRLKNFYHKTFCTVFVPEFLREKSAFYDFTEGHDTCVIGCKRDDIYELLKKAHGHFPKKFVKVSPTEAELTKYFSNTFNAMRVTFANAFYDVCTQLGADYTTVKNAAATRPTVTDLYLDCNENFRGFGGPCLPKDTAALAKLADDLNIPAEIFKIIVSDNKLYKTTVFEGMRKA